MAYVRYPFRRRTGPPPDDEQACEARSRTRRAAHRRPNPGRPFPHSRRTARNAAPSHGSHRRRANICLLDRRDLMQAARTGAPCRSRTRATTRLAAASAEDDGERRAPTALLHTSMVAHAEPGDGAPRAPRLPFDAALRRGLIAVAPPAVSRTNMARAVCLRYRGDQAGKDKSGKMFHYILSQPDPTRTPLSNDFKNLPKPRTRKNPRLLFKFPWA